MKTVVYEILMILTLVYGIECLGTYTHESIHQRICEYHGGEYVTHWGYMLKANTICDKGTDETVRLDSWTEIIGYTITGFTSSITLIVIWWRLTENIK